MRQAHFTTASSNPMINSSWEHDSPILGWPMTQRRADWRKAPVPMTGFRRRHRSATLRYPRTLGALREGRFCDHEAPSLRATAWGGMPTAWDDVLRSTERSWKRHRRYQAHGR